MKSSVLGHYNETSLSIVYRKSIPIARLARPVCLADLVSGYLAVLVRLRTKVQGQTTIPVGHVPVNKSGV